MICKLPLNATIATLIFISSGSLLAGTRDLNSAVHQAILWDEINPDRDKRLIFAQAIKAYWSDLNDKLPRLSPNEEEWISEELSSNSEARLTKALNSSEYGLRQVANKVDTCISTVGRVIDAITDPSQHSTEMFHWLKMINCYDGSNDLFNYLELAGVPVTQDYSYEGNDKIFATWGSFTQGTIVNKAAATAMVETMGWTLTDE